MIYEYRKLREITDDLLAELETGGWEFDGTVKAQGVDTGIMRFRRYVKSEATLTPLDVVQKNESK